MERGGLTETEPHTAAKSHEQGQSVCMCVCMNNHIQNTAMEKEPHSDNADISTLECFAHFMTAVLHK